MKKFFHMKQLKAENINGSYNRAWKIEKYCGTLSVCNVIKITDDELVSKITPLESCLLMGFTQSGLWKHYKRTQKWKHDLFINGQQYCGWCFRRVNKMSKINEKAWVRPYNASQEYHKIHNFLFRNRRTRVLYCPNIKETTFGGKKNIKQFFNDIEYHYEDEKPMWLGSILVSTGGGHGGKIVLIDGQQRILSYTLIWNILTEFKYNNIFDIKGENEWDDIYSGTENITYKTFLDYIDNKKKNIEPKIENKHFKAIIKIIYQKKEEWLSKEILSKIQDWIKEFLYINVLCCENTYEYFENLNSKNEPLNLKAKCYAYMASKYPNKVLQNKSIISWWLSNKYDKYIKKKCIRRRIYKYLLW